MKQQDEGQKKSAARRSQGTPQPAANDGTPPDTLKMQTLARLGLWKEPPPTVDDTDATMKGVPIWQSRIWKIQSLVERGKQGDNKAINQIEAFLGNKYVEVGIAAVCGLEELTRVGRIAPRHFFYYLTAPAKVRAVVILALASMAVKPLPNGLLDQFLQEVQNEQEEQTVRIAIIQLLGTLGRHEPLEVLGQLLEGDPDWLVREAVVNAIVTLRDSLDEQAKRGLNKMLIPALYDENAFVREAAVVALRESFPLNTILSDLHGKDTGKREKAARALGAAGKVTPAVLERLAKHATGDAVPAVRKAAILALSCLDVPIDDATLTTLLKDRDEEVHAAALILEDMQSVLDDEQDEGRQEG